MEEKKGGGGGEGGGGGDDEGPPTVTPYVVVPPDGGWGWVIVAASFVCNFIVDGIVFSFGFLLEKIAEDLNASQTQVSLAGSLLSGVYMISGPFVSALANRYGFRLIAMSGSVFGLVSFAISSYSSSVEILWISYGLCGGIGLGLIYVPAVIACGFYFEKWRALATGIAVCGSGIATISFGPITNMLLDKIGWRHTVLVYSGLVLSCAAFGALFRPLKPVQVEVPEEEDEEVAEGKLPLMQRIKLAREQLRREDSVISIEKEVGLAAASPDSPGGILRAHHNATYPTAAEALAASTQSLAKSRHSLAPKEKRYSITATETEPAHENHEQEPLSHDHPEEVFLMKRLSKTAVLESGGGRRDSITLRYRTRTTSEGSGPRSRRGTISKEAGPAGVRPLYRDDIFLQASLNRLPQFTSHGSGLDYTMSVSRLPTWKDVQEEEDASCQLCPEAMRRTLATMLDFSLLRSPTFLLFCLAGFMTMMGLFIPFMFLKGRAYEMGLGDQAVLLVASIGITNTLGRIICGAVSSLPNSNSLLINNVALTVGGIITLASGLSSTAAFQFTFTALFGLSIACFASLRSIMIVDLFGLENLTNAFGLLLLFQGVAAIIGPPLAGLFKEQTQSYDASFLLSGSLLLLSGVMCYPLNWLSNWEKRRNERRANHTVQTKQPSVV